MRGRLPDKDIWLWTGYGLEEALRRLGGSADLIDVIVAGPFKASEADLSLLWRGSRNQTIWRRGKKAWARCESAGELRKYCCQQQQGADRWNRQLRDGASLEGLRATWSVT